MAKFGIFEKIYHHNYEADSRFRELEVVRIDDNNRFYSYQNDESYSLNQEKLASKEGVGMVMVGKTINSHFLDYDSYTKNVDGKVFDLDTGAGLVVYEDVEYLLSKLMSSAEAKMFKTSFPFLFEGGEPSQQLLNQCQYTLNEIYNKRPIARQFKKINRVDQMFAKHTHTHNINWYVIDFSKEQEK